jgi:hypothetical protein
MLKAAQMCPAKNRPFVVQGPGAAGKNKHTVVGDALKEAAPACALVGLVYLDVAVTMWLVGSPGIFVPVAGEVFVVTTGTLALEGLVEFVIAEYVMPPLGDWINDTFG